MKNSKSIKALLESEMEKAELVLSVKAITDELQSMAEKISKMQVEDVSAISERLKAETGVDSGTEFQSSVNQILQTALTGLQAAKSEVDNEALFLSGDAQKDGMVPQAPEQTIAAPADETGSEEDMFAGHEAGAGPEEEPVGRAKRESISSRKKASNEEVYPDDEEYTRFSARPDYSKTSLPNEKAMDTALRHVGQLNDPEVKALTTKTFDIAKEAELVAVGRIEKTVEEMKLLRDEVSNEIENVATKLSDLHPTDYGKIVALSGDAKILVRAKRKLESAIYDKSREETQNMVSTLESKGMTESAIYKKSVALLEKWEKNTKTNLKKKGMWDGWTIAELRKERTKLKDKEKRTAAESTRLKEVDYAIRAKTGWGKIKESAENGYICFYKGKKIEVYAPTSFAAQKKAAEQFKAKKSYEVSVHLARRAGEDEDVIHVATESTNLTSKLTKRRNELKDEIDSTDDKQKREFFRNELEAVEREIRKRHENFKESTMLESKDTVESLRKEIKEVNAKIDDIIDDGGKVSLTDPLSVKLNRLRAKLKKAKEAPVKKK